MINVLTFIKYFLRLAMIIMLLGNLGICVDFPKATFTIFPDLLSRLLKFMVRVLLKMIQRFVIFKKEGIVLLKNAWEWTPV